MARRRVAIGPVIAVSEQGMEGGTGKMRSEDAEEYTQALGQVIAGGWRQIALGQRLGVPKALGLSTGKWVEERLGGYIKLSIEERREAVKELVADGNSQRQVAGILGINQTTVKRDLCPDANASPVAVLDDVMEEASDAFASPDSRPLDVITGLAADEALRKQAIKPKPHVANNSGDNEWYTPPEYIKAACRVMGKIDLDPASSDIANQTVGASRYFTIENDGLSQPWSGRVFLNPPYSSELVGRFTHKLVVEVITGSVTQAIVLVNDAMETIWLQEVLVHAAAACFPRGRIKFLDTFGNPGGAPLQGQAILYLGEKPRVFAEHFGVFGVVLFG